MQNKECGLNSLSLCLGFSSLDYYSGTTERVFRTMGSPAATFAFILTTAERRPLIGWEVLP